MSNSILQSIGKGMLANLIPDPGASGSIRIGDAGIAVCDLTVAANSRVIEDGSTPGQILILVNSTGGTRQTITDTATTLNLSIDANQAAILVYTGVSTIPWAATLLTAGTVT